MTVAGCAIRLARPEDLPAIVDIYNASIPGRLATADTEPVSVEQRREWFDRHTLSRPIWVAVNEQPGEDEQVLGWVSLEPFYGRPAYAQTVEVSLYLHPDAQGRGLGRTLLEFVLSQARSLDITHLVAYIFSHNAPSLGLFRKAGFESWGQLPGIAKMDGQRYGLTILGRVLSEE